MKLSERIQEACAEILGKLQTGLWRRIEGLASRSNRSLGQSFVIIAFSFVGILAFIGFVVDTGIIYLHRVWLYQAVDAASLAAGYELPNIHGACARAVEYLQANGYDPGDNVDFQLTFPARPDAPDPPGDPGEFVIDSIVYSIDDPSDCSAIVVPAQHKDMHYEVEVSATQDVQLIFMHIVGFGQVTVAAPSTTERSARFDVVLILDRSGSMKFDSCTLTRPDYSCENRYQPCVAFRTEDFEDIEDTEDLEDDGWRLSEDNVQVIHSMGNTSVELSCAGDQSGYMYRTFNTTGFENVALYYSINDTNLAADGELMIYWRPNDEVGWSRIVKYTADVLPDDTFQPGAVMLPSAAANNPELQIRFRVTSEGSKQVELDDIQLRSCSEMIGPWIWYYEDYDDGCHPERTMTCDVDDPTSLLPGNSYASNQPPRAQLIEQPVTDVLFASEKFIDIMDARHLPEQPREDMIGLVKYNLAADNLHDLTTDYETLKALLFSSINAYGGTGTARAMGVGLSILGDGRFNSIHYMILLSDGWPNGYDLPYENPTSFEHYCPGGDPCEHALKYIEYQIEQANAQNVTIFTIGLGDDLNTMTFDGSAVYGPGTENISGMYVLERIASQTGGAAYHAPTTDELGDIFQWIADAIFIRLTG